MNKIKLLLSVVVVGVGSAITYHIFENTVHGAIQLIWYDTFNTDYHRWAVVPLAIILSIVFFGLQHYLDKSSENAQEHGLGDMPKPTIINFAKVLLIGLGSLVAGATLGPEAILVPACMILGAYAGKKLLKSDKQLVSLLAAAGLMALFTAFFDSFWVGVLSLFLVLSRSKTTFKPALLVVAIFASGSAKLTLNAINGEAYIPLPHYGWHLNLITVLLGLVLVVAGFVSVHIISYIHKIMLKLRDKLKISSWILTALLAGAVIASLYLLGGPLVEFTGNKSIEPLFNQAAGIGLLGLLWILVVKICLISWSKAIGFRGGMIFPTIFLAAVLIAIVQLYVKDFNYTYGFIAVLIGAFGANKKTHILV